MASLLRLTLASCCLAAPLVVVACPPPQTFVPWEKTVEFAESRSDTIALAELVREEEVKGQYADRALRYYIKPTRVFKGKASGMPAYLQKELNQTCDQSPFVRKTVLVFALDRQALLITTPEGGGAAGSSGKSAHELALEQVGKKTPPTRP